MQNCFVPADILLPSAATPLDPWACIAVDQFTSQPEYWQKAEELAQGKPSTLHIVLPEAYLGTPQEEPRLAAIAGDGAAIQQNIAAMAGQCAGHGAQQGSFSAAVRANQRSQLAIWGSKAHIPHHVLRAIARADML